MVDTPVPSVVVEFLSRVLPCKTKADLYTTIGLQKHGKTEFYRDFLRHLGHSSDEFVVAPGMRGLVMAVFTLPSYPYVFKVIRDHFPPPKETTRTAVMAKYRLVKEHDRVGRMADSLEYSDAAFPLARFSEQLRRELAHEAASGIEIDGDQLVIRHLYIERRMTPLNVFLHRADDAAQQRAMDDYGRAIRELAAANIFPGDMLLKNFGVTRQGRVVFYDYDDICYLTECNFRRIPEPPCPEFEFAAEPWYSVEQADVFPEEFATFLVSSPRLRAAFLAGHAELLDPRWWQARQAGATAGRFEDVFPYPEASRFVRTLRHHRPPLPSPTGEIPSAACG
jgi:isocitrate dehydrogenase kinase/phosphatase